MAGIRHLAAALATLEAGEASAAVDSNHQRSTSRQHVVGRWSLDVQATAHILLLTSTTKAHSHGFLGLL